MPEVHCAEIWGGINVTSEDVCTSGITATIHSSASGATRGGDIYYFSVCSYDILTRVVLADMRGHGEEAAELSDWLYQLLLDYMNSLDGSAILRSLNEKIVERGFHALTTAVVLSFNRLDGTLFYANAGHPPPLAWSPKDGWKNLQMIDSLGPANLPLGIKSNTHYDQAFQILAPGDRLFIYSDGITECPNPNGEFFDEDRLLRILNANRNEDLHTIKQSLKHCLEVFSNGPLVHDDCTFLCFEVRN